MPSSMNSARELTTSTIFIYLWCECLCEWAQMSTFGREVGSNSEHFPKFMSVKKKSKKIEFL